MRGFLGTYREVGKFHESVKNPIFVLLFKILQIYLWAKIIEPYAAREEAKPTCLQITFGGI
jgi:NADPH-dependent 7-cyano-7-deazaguanine reductase QueF